MNKDVFSAILLLIFITAGAVLYFLITDVPPEGTDEPAGSGFEEPITLDAPASGSVVASPIRISGSARGQWYFEATFPVRIETDEGEVIAEHYAEAQGEWVRVGSVPFEAELSFQTSYSGPVHLVLEKANPSGLPEHADERRVPLVLATSTAIGEGL